jgi:hypothetical protein
MSPGRGLQSACAVQFLSLGVVVRVTSIWRAWHGEALLKESGREAPLPGERKSVSCNVAVMHRVASGLL